MTTKEDIGNNSEGYVDKTASQAIARVIRSERRKVTEREKDVSNLVHITRQVADALGLELVERIVIRDKKTGKVYR